MTVQVEQAITLLSNGLAPVAEECCPLLLAAGRVLGREVVAAVSQPPFPRSPLDGYAVRASDIGGANPENPATLRVTSAVYAGMEAVLPVGCGEAAKIMTGGMMPPGAYCVVRQEDTDRGEPAVRVFVSHRAGENIVPLGEDFSAGDALLPAGTLLDCAALATAAAGGAAELWVRGRPKVALIATGDELAKPGERLRPGQIYDACLPYLWAGVLAFGGDCVMAEAVGDDAARIERVLRRAVEAADLVITTGGVSVGERDFVPAVLGGMGAEVLFHGVAMKPGMPTLGAVLGGRTVLGLSGNPFAAAVGFELLGRAVLYTLGGHPAAALRRETGTMKTPFIKHSPGRRFVRAVWRNGEVSAPKEQQNGQIRSMVGCNCLIDLRAGTGPLAAGDMVEVIML